MSAHNRVIWSEGLFLQPQHFQQQERYFERYVEARCQALVPHSWGFTEIEFERDFLSIGKVGAAARWPACFPTARRSGCRTTIRCRRRSTSAPTCAIRSLYLAVPLRRSGELDVGPRGGRGRTGPARRPRVPGAQRRVEQRRPGAARSRRAAHAAPAGERGHRGLRLHSARARRRMPRGPAGRARRAASFRRSCTCAAAGRLATFTTELLGLLHQRGEALAGRVAATGRGAAAEFADFLMLQAINRYEPVLAHFADTGDAASRGAVSGLRVGGGRAGDVHRRRRSGRRSFPPTGTSVCGSRSSR